MPSRRKRSLNHKTAIVTGASSGIGRATAIALARAGCHTLLVARNAAELKETARLVQDARPDRRSVVLALDITDPTAPEIVRRRTIEEHGRIDILVNNAGVNAFGRIEDVPEELIRQMFELNVWAPVRLIRAVVPVMRKKRSGAIVNVSSIVGFRGLPRTAMYSASKAALNAMTEGLRLEVARDGIAVVNVFPGLTSTRMHANTLYAGAAPPTPRRTSVPPERVAGAIVQAIRNRERDVYVTLPDRIFVASALALPGVWDMLLKILDRIRGR